MAIENILTPVDVIIAELGKFKVSISKILKGVADKQEELNSIKVAQNARAEGLDVREAEVKKTEDIIILKENTKKLIVQADEGTKALLKSQQIFNSDVAKQNKEIADEKAKNEQIRIKNERDSAALVKAREELEEDKKTYKEKLVKELIAKAK